MTRPPTKADLAAAVARLTQEKAELLELVKAIGETALLPQPDDDHELGYRLAARDMANVIGILCQMTASGEVYLPSAARQVRKERAEQEVKYKHYASPAIDSESWKCAGCGGQCIAGRPADGLCRECAGRAPAEPAGLEDAAPVVRVLDDGGPLPRRVPAATLDGATARTGGEL